MGRTLVATGAPGWFRDMADPDGPKVRRQDGDEVLTLNEATASRASTGNGNRGTEAAKAAVREREPQSTVAETGKVLKGKTVTIRCRWTENGKRCTNERTIKPQDAFQVKYCVGHQEEHRKRLHRDKQRRRAAERRKAKQAATA